MAAFLIAVVNVALAPIKASRARARSGPRITVVLQSSESWIVVQQIGPGEQLVKNNLNDDSPASRLTLRYRPTLAELLQIRTLGELFDLPELQHLGPTCRHYADKPENRSAFCDRHWQVKQSLTILVPRGSVALARRAECGYLQRAVAVTRAAVFGP